MLVKKISIGYIPQQVASFNAGFPSTVIELVRSGRFPRNRWFKTVDEKDHLHVEKSFEISGYVGNAPQNELASFLEGKSNELV